jgi:hypothetical protein
VLEDFGMEKLGSNADSVDRRDITAMLIGRASIYNGAHLDGQMAILVERSRCRADHRGGNDEIGSIARLDLVSDHATSGICSGEDADVG